MQAALHGAKLKKKGGPSKSVASSSTRPPEDRKMFSKKG
jgi:hypothetical protein